MEKVELMHRIYGKGEPGYKCGINGCHFFHWKIEGDGAERHQAYRWCEVYGLNQDDVTETDWEWGYQACGCFNACETPPKKNIYKLAKKDGFCEQQTLFCGDDND